MELSLIEDTLLTYTQNSSVDFVLDDCGSMQVMMRLHISLSRYLYNDVVWQHWIKQGVNVSYATTYYTVLCRTTL